MAKLPSNLIQRGRKFSYKRRVPNDIIALGGFLGKTVIQFSLVTSEERDARRKALELDKWFDEECEQIRNPAPPTPVSSLAPSPIVLTDSVLKEARNHYKAVEIRDYNEMVIQAELDDAMAQYLETEISHYAPAYSKNLRGEIVDEEKIDLDHQKLLTEKFEDQAAFRTEIHAKKIGILAGTSDYKRLRNMFLDAARAAHEEKTASVGQGNFGDGYNPNDIKSDPLNPRSAWTLDTLKDDYLAATGKGASWQHKVDVAVSAFKDHMGKPVAISAITKADLKAFVEMMLTAPSNAEQRYPGMSINDAIAANARRTPSPYRRMAANTVKNNYLGPLKALLGYAYERLECIPTDPSDKLKVPGSSKKSSKRPRLDNDELNALFRLPLFTGCRSDARTLESGNYAVTDHRYWVPLLMLYAGARPSELAQLAVTDIKLDTKHPSIDILTEYDENDPDDRPYVQAFKTANARRRIPLNPALLELGFDRYITQMKAKGAVRLFPKWKASSDPRKLYSTASWIRRFNDKLIPAITNRRPKPSLYSLRHAFKTQMALLGIAPSIQDQVMGHAPIKEMDSIYIDQYLIAETYPELAKLHYPELDLSHLSGRMTVE